MKKKLLTLFVASLALPSAVSVAFAHDSSPKTSSAANVEYSIQMLIDGEAPLPATHHSVSPGSPILLDRTIGENPYTGEQQKRVTFDVIPQVTSEGLELVGSFTGKIGNQQVEHIFVDNTIQRGKATQFSFEMDGKTYEVVLKAVF